MFSCAFFLLSLLIFVNSNKVLQTNQTVQNLLTDINVNATDQIVKSNICTSESCANESAVILKYLDQNVDPCQNFYEFACGKYLNETKLTKPDDKTSGTLFTKLQHKVSEQLVEILPEESKPDEPHAIRLSKQLMKTCLNETMLNEQGIAPMVEILERYGGWPVVMGDKWNANDWNWVEIQKKMYNDGFTNNLILEVSFGPHHKNSSKNVLNVMLSVHQIRHVIYALQKFNLLIHRID